MTVLAIAIDDGEDFISIGPFDSVPIACDFVMRMVERECEIGSAGNHWFVIDAFALDRSPEEYERMASGSNISQLRKGNNNGR